MQIRKRVSRRAIATLFIASLTGCASDDFRTLQASLDPLPGRTVYVNIMPCHVWRAYFPSLTPIKKGEPRRNLIRIIEGGDKSLPEFETCHFEITAAGRLQAVPGSCAKLVSPEWCEGE